MMESLVLNPSLIKVLDNPELIWDSLKKEEEIQYFWLGKQPYTPIWELQKQLHAKSLQSDNCVAALDMNFTPKCCSMKV